MGVNSHCTYIVGFVIKSTDSTETAGKTHRYPRQNRGKGPGTVFPGYIFNTFLLPYTKILLKTAAISEEEEFLQLKIHQNTFAAGGPTERVESDSQYRVLCPMMNMMMMSSREGVNFPQGGTPPIPYPSPTPSGKFGVSISSVIDSSRPSTLRLGAYVGKGGFLEQTEQPHLTKLSKSTFLNSAIQF